MIAIEGTKGSGKSTVIKHLLANLHLLPLEPALSRPTASAPGWLPVNQLLEANPALSLQDEWQEKLYAERAAWHAAQIPENARWILADRCIATSYATRWQKWNNPQLTIKRVDRLHCNVPIPQWIIWLDCKPALALQRIEQRARRNYGLQDQTPKRLKETYHAYHDIMHRPPPKLAGTQWYKVDAGQPLQNLLPQILDMINHCLQQQHQPATTHI
jgi:thymidylate kinase